MRSINPSTTPFQIPSEKPLPHLEFCQATAVGEYKSMLFVEQAMAVEINRTQIKPRVGVAIYVRLGDVKAELNGSFRLQVENNYI